MKFKLDFSDLSTARLEVMKAAGDTIQDCYRVLLKGGANVVGQCLANQGKFYEDNHYPKGDVYDDEYKSQYYYHAHRPESGEHGHFHTFVRSGAIPKGISPAPYEGPGERPLGKDSICHLVAIAMNGPGYPISLFSTNRWVTGETFYSASDIDRIVEAFKIDHTFPCLATNQWITAMIQLFRPQIEVLASERDRKIARWKSKRDDKDVYEDRDLDLTSIIDIDVDDQVAAVDKALKDSKHLALTAI